MGHAPMYEEQEQVALERTASEACHSDDKDACRSNDEQACHSHGESKFEPLNNHYDPNDRLGERDVLNGSVSVNGANGEEDIRVFRLSGVRWKPEWKTAHAEKEISGRIREILARSIKEGNEQVSDFGEVSIVECDICESREEAEILFVVYDSRTAPDEVVRTLNDDFSRSADHMDCSTEFSWLLLTTSCALVDDDEELFEEVSESEAYEMWRNEADEIRTALLKYVPSPDGEMIMPEHDACKADGSEHVLPGAEQSSEEKLSTQKQQQIPTQLQLRRDPSLLTFDNVRRIDVREIATNPGLISSANFNEPLIITGLLYNDVSGKPLHVNRSQLDFLAQLGSSHLALEDLVKKFGSVEVRTGNRNTLIENGFNHSKPMRLAEAFPSLLSMHEPTKECSRMVFSPVKELPETFREYLQDYTSRMKSVQLSDSDSAASSPATAAATSEKVPLVGGTGAASEQAPPSWVAGSASEELPLANQVPAIFQSSQSLKFTLCLANEGFGIGMHKHGAAFFFLVEGRKKWYMAPSKGIDELLAGEGEKVSEKKSPLPSSCTHPFFYTDLSTHKCIQSAGELLYVPDDWYHEIFNLEYTAGIQALET